MYLQTRRDGDTLEAELAGSWRGADLPAIDAELAALPLDGIGTLRISVPDSLELDLAGAWRLREWIKAAREQGIDSEFAGEEPGQLALINATLEGKVHAEPASSSEPAFQPVSSLGRQVTRRWESVKLALEFLGHTTITWMRAVTSWRFTRAYPGRMVSKRSPGRT